MNLRLAYLAVSCGCLAAQTTPASLATELESAAAAVSVQPPLFDWEAAYANERIDPAHYLADGDPYETDFNHHDQWCVTSVAQTPQDITRAATFYVEDSIEGDQ